MNDLRLCSFKDSSSVEFYDAGRAIFAELLCCSSGLCEVGFLREDSYLLGM